MNEAIFVIVRRGDGVTREMMPEATSRAIIVAVKSMAILVRFS